jgi:hypothetical protein
MSRFVFWQPQRRAPIFWQPQGRGPIKTLVEIYDELQSRVPAISRDCRTFFSLERWMRRRGFSKLDRTSASEPRLSGRKSTVRVSTVWPALAASSSAFAFECRLPSKESRLAEYPMRLPASTNANHPKPARNRHFCDLSHNRLSGAEIASDVAGSGFDKGRTSFMMYVDNARQGEALP